MYVYELRTVCVWVCVHVYINVCEYVCMCVCVYMRLILSFQYYHQMLLVMTICVRVSVHMYESVSILYESEFISMSLHVRMHLSETVCMYESVVWSVSILEVNR